jgi:hypothetical protein
MIVAEAGHYHRPNATLAKCVAAATKYHRAVVGFIVDFQADLALKTLHRQDRLLKYFTKIERFAGKLGRPY